MTRRTPIIDPRQDARSVVADKFGVRSQADLEARIRLGDVYRVDPRRIRRLVIADVTNLIAATPFVVNNGDEVLLADGPGGLVVIGTIPASPPAAVAMNLLPNPAATVVAHVYHAPGASTAINTTAAETAFSNSYSLPANSGGGGRCLHIRAYGGWSVVAATSPTLTLRIRLNDGGVFTNLLDFGAAPASVGQSGGIWEIEAWAQLLSTSCRMAGRLGTTAARSAAENATRLDGKSTSGLDWTKAYIVEITAQWSASAAGNTCDMTWMQVDWA